MWTWCARRTLQALEYLNAMAALGEGPYKTTDVSRQMGKKPSALSQRRDTAIGKGMIFSPGYGEIDFTVPLFDDYLRRRAAGQTEGATGA